jgi:hypothetical protein
MPCRKIPRAGRIGDGPRSAQADASLLRLARLKSSFIAAKEKTPPGRGSDCSTACLIGSLNKPDQLSVEHVSSRCSRRGPSSRRPPSCRARSDILPALENLGAGLVGILFLNDDNFHFVCDALFLGHGRTKIQKARPAPRQRRTLAVRPVAIRYLRRRFAEARVIRWHPMVV